MYYPSEWQQQVMTLLVWPHPSHDWESDLAEVEASYVQMTQAISQHQPLLIVTFDQEHQQRIATLLSNTSLNHPIRYHRAKTNDSWVRDTGPITSFTNKGAIYNDFAFNAWGGKYQFELDNLLNQNLATCSDLNQTWVRHPLVLEGGSIESDGNGTVLTTTSCLLNKNRNPNMSQAELEHQLEQTLGAKQCLWLEVEPIAGDDTDGHIDTVARFCPNNTICYLEHLTSTGQTSVENQLKAMRNLDAEPYRLVSLPYQPIVENNRKLAASYANFLIVNNAVLVPQYQSELDSIALAKIGDCFPDFDLYPIDARCFIRQGGSVHCLTMHIPEFDENLGLHN